VKVKISKIVID